MADITIFKFQNLLYIIPIFKKHIHISIKITEKHQNGQWDDGWIYS